MQESVQVCDVPVFLAVVSSAQRGLRKSRPSQIYWTWKEDEGDFVNHAKENGKKARQVLVGGDSESLSLSLPPELRGKVCFFLLMV